MKVYVKKVPCEKGSQVLVLSEGREEKEKAMDALKEERFIEDINKLKESISKRNILKPEKVAIRLGRIQERYPSIARYYDIDLVLKESGKEARDVNLVKKESRNERYTLTGCYVIKTTYKDLDAKEIWELYSILTQVEYSFRCLKTDLGMRPVHHHLSERTQGHLFISVLAYHLLICIESQLREHEDTRKWETIKKRTIYPLQDYDNYE